jgi:O-antigen/teichoic acid export membrane protein
VKPFNASGDFQPINKGGALRRVAVRSAGITVLGQGASFFVQVASTMILARLLTPKDFGIITMVTTVGLLFRSFGLNGFTELIMQREELTDSLASNLFWIELVIGALLTAVFAGSGPLLALFYRNPAVAPAAAGMSLMIGIGCLGWIHLALLQRAMRFRATAIINFAGQLVLVIISIALAMAGWNYWSLVWGVVAQTIAVVAGAWLACRWVPSRPRRASGTKSGIKFAINVYLHYAFSYSTHNTDNLLVGWRYGAQALGFYKKAYDLFVLAETQLMYPISAVAISTFSRVSHDREQFQRYFLRTISVLALLGMGIGADFALVGKDLIRVLLGPGWEEAGRIFALFGPGIGVMMLYNTHGWVHLAIGRPERWFRWGLFEFACTACLFLLGLHWGPSGIALAWTISYFLLMIPGFWYAGKPIGLGVLPVLTVIGKFFAASAAAGCGTVLILRFVPAFEMTLGAPGALLRMVLVSLLFFGLYICCVILLHGGLKPISETTDLLRDLLPERTVGRTVPVAVD